MYPRQLRKHILAEVLEGRCLLVASKWDDMERWMERQQLPKGFELLREPDWVEQYVRKMMTKALPEAAGVMIGGGSASFSETRHFVHVKINLPDGFDKEQLRLFVREDRLRLEGLPGGKIETIKLPKLVKPRLCKTQLQDAVLKVKLQKRPTNRSFHEAIVRW
ncbi:HSP20 family molecular chaperone IbpA [Paenibacillus endophyticus]|uniref:HSP20 family molecular chaperone IbpA n=1 Tax=Paenibacillus endophyticus TaxID=1294268 RepID=A0A7W5CFI9_9BACL|nr:Hsp20/alpha crystallin family protein [Paenibacillus endophyticus]MBB3156284.1 HSP20 family molecular chaperone IbpA [Paenibacillus endophyticus]